MVSYLGTFVQSRKLHSVLAFFIILAACFVSFGGRGFAIEHSRGGAHARELSYATTAETLSSGYIVSDIKIQRCIRGVACKAPKDGEFSFWQKAPAKLNLFPRNKQAFNYFMYVEKSKIFESERYVIDVTFTTTDSPPKPLVEGAEIDTHKIPSGGYMWIQYITAVMPQVPMVRDVNVLFGQRSMSDPRKYWKVNPGKIPIAGEYEIDVRMSLMKANVLQEVQILQTEREFEGIFKKNEILVSPHPKFKIMQIGDMALTDRAYGSCQGPHCTKDADTLKFIKTAIEQEKDVRLIIITGFTLVSAEDDHPESVLLEALSPILESRIPFIYASSDGIWHWENPAVRRNFENFLASLPGCYNKKFEDLDHRIRGVANGNLKIYSIPRKPAGVYTDYNAVISRGADAYVTYLDSRHAMLDPSQSNFLYRINKGDSAKTEHKLLFLDHPFVSQYAYPREFRDQPLSEAEFKKYLDDFRVNGYKAIAFNNPQFDKMDSQTCEWQSTEDSKVLKCLPGLAGAAWGMQKDIKREVRLFEFDFKERNIVSWRRDSSSSSEAQLIWTGEPKPLSQAEAEAEKEAEKESNKESEADDGAAVKGAKEPQDAQKADAQKEDAQKEDAQKEDAQKEDAQKEDAQKEAVEGETEDQVDDTGSGSDKSGNSESEDAKENDSAKPSAEELAEELVEEVAQEMTEAENKAEGETTQPDAKEGADEVPK